MELLLERKWKKELYTIGKLSINGEFFCNTLEDTDRGLAQTMSLPVLRAKKRRGITAIPTGRYRVTLDVRSPKYSLKRAYDFCQGYVPRLINVPAYEGVLIHIGNYPKDTEGCILVGKNTKVGAVMESTDIFKQLYCILKGANEPIYITIR